MMSSMNTAFLGRTGLIGGDDGQRFNDLDKMIKDGKLNLDAQNPIKKMEVYAGWVVDGMCVTYKGADGSPMSFVHGSRQGGVQNVVELSPSECIISMFGRAGYQDYYKRKMINSIGFNIFDRSTCKSRTVGPFGNQNNSNNGEPYNTGEVMGFGGYAQDIPQLGLCGLYIFQKMGGSFDNLMPVQVPEVMRSGMFNSSDVREWQKPVPDSRQTISLQPPHVQGHLPKICCGLNFLDVDCGFNIRCRALIESTSNDCFVANMQSWSDTRLYSAGMSWLDVPLGRNIQGGVIPHQWSIRTATTEPFVLGNIRFERPFSKPPKVLVWMTGLDMDKAKNWRMKTLASNITMTGFTASVQTWSDSIMYGSGMCWMAVDSDAQDVCIGKFTGNTSSQSGQLQFEREFSRKPRVMCALSGIDFQMGKNLRCKTSVDNITEKGCKWNMNTWSDSVMHWAEGSYIAILDHNN